MDFMKIIYTCLLIHGPNMFSNWPCPVSKRFNSKDINVMNDIGMKSKKLFRFV